MALMLTVELGLAIAFSNETPGFRRSLLSVLPLGTPKHSKTQTPRRLRMWGTRSEPDLITLCTWPGAHQGLALVGRRQADGVQADNRRRKKTFLWKMRKELSA
jgi:hypothetical protein